MYEDDNAHKRPLSFIGHVTQLFSAPTSTNADLFFIYLHYPDWGTAGSDKVGVLETSHRL